MDLVPVAAQPQRDAADLRSADAAISREHEWKTAMPAHDSDQPASRSPTQATLVSALPPDELTERLADLLPRFTPSGNPLPRFGLSLSNYYLGRVSGRSFRLFGPYSGNLPLVSVSGSIEDGPEGSLIRLRLVSTAHYIPLTIWVLGLIVSGLFGVFSHMIVIAVALATFFCIFAAVFYPLARRSERRGFHRLVDCLARLLNADEESFA